MEKMRIAMGRSGRVWPAVLKTVMEGRRMGRRVILYVPEQMTLQTERDLIGDLRLKGLLDIEVISPRKLRLMVREKTGGTPRRTLDAAGQVMAVHRAMTEQAKELGFYRNMTDFPGAVERVRGALAELLESDLTPEEAEGWANRQEGGAAGPHRGEGREQGFILNDLKAHRSVVVPGGSEQAGPQNGLQLVAGDRGSAELPHAPAAFDQVLKIHGAFSFQMLQRSVKLL